MKMIGMNHNNHFYEEYLKGLEKERKKIQVFRRELPLCLQLVNQAIETCKQQLCCTSKHSSEESECDEQIESSKLWPIVGGFFPITRTSSDELGNNFQNDKSDWLKSAQLWNQSPQISPSKEKVDSATRALLPEVNGGSTTSSGAFHSFKRDNRAKLATKTIKSVASSSDHSKKKKEAKGKTRRSWSQELHKRFLHALHQLGGSHVATPKQIREVMKEDELTNDEVKSHLQKYRLHERRPNASLSSNNQQQAPQFVVVGSIWLPPPEYPTGATSSLSEEVSRTTPRVYAPVAAPPPHHHFRKEPCSNDMVTTATTT